MKGYIYKVTNRKNNLCYIGQSYKCANSRYREHWAEANNGWSKTKFHCALREYDITNWIFEVLFFEEKQESESEDDFYSRLTDIEGEYIIKFNSFKNGYNSRNSLSSEQRGKKIQLRAPVVKGRWFR